VLASLYPQEDSWYSLLLEIESIPGFRCYFVEVENLIYLMLVSGEVGEKTERYIMISPFLTVICNATHQ
jgi:hypothetical protein